MSKKEDGSFWNQVEKRVEENSLIVKGGMPEEWAEALVLVGLKFWQVTILVSLGLALIVWWQWRPLVLFAVRWIVWR